MNKYQKELLEKCKKDYNKKPLFDEIIVINTNKKHDSSYNIMYVIGVCCKNYRDEEYYLLSKYCDVLEFDLFDNIRIDVKNGIIRYWTGYNKKFKTIYDCSCCEFELVNI